MPLPGILHLFSFIINKLQRSNQKIKLSVPCPLGSGAVYVSRRKTVANIKRSNRSHYGCETPCVGSFYLRLQTMGSLNSGGIREKQ